MAQPKEHISPPPVVTRIRTGLFGSRARTIGTIAVSVLLAFLIWKSLVQTSHVPQYRTATAIKTTIISTVTESGNISSGIQAGINSPVSGTVESVFVKDGDTVVTGQKLFTVKSSATPQDQAAAYAAYLNAVSAGQSARQNKLAVQSQLEQARQTILVNQNAVDSMNAVLGAGGVNPTTRQGYTVNEIESIKSALTSARENFAALESKYAQADTAINAASANTGAQWLAYEATQDTTVTAPVPGTVANIAFRPGQQVSGSNPSNQAVSGSGTPSGAQGSQVMMVADFGTPYVTIQASEVDIPRIRTGQKATVTLDAFPGRTLVGSVRQADSVGTNTSGVVTYTVTVDIENPPGDIRPGMSSSVAIQTDRRDDVVAVPSGAVSSTGGQATVRVIENGAVRTVPVKTGLSSDTDTEIVSGLKEGDVVVTGTSSGQTGTSPGSSPFGGNLRIGGNAGFGGGRGR